ncbi:thiamine pyrophosphate-binding protein [Candidatus Pelagibacter ubique]|nr:thiamine pyrophosphate-binding protein [Candidatus Pelagibacter ubique]
MNLSDYVLYFLEKKKVNNVFTITGGAICFLMDAFSRNKNMKYTAVAHEQAAAMMADSYSRLGPNFSATMVTSGPGATNLLTGIACSWFDSIPSLHICGQVNRHELASFGKSTKKVRQVGFQETDIVSMSKPITKFAYQLKNENEIRYILEKAFYLSQEGRPGPVLIDIPMNLQRKIIDPKKLKSFFAKKKSPKKQKLINQINKILSQFKKSKRPVIIIGGGIRISKTNKELIFFLKNMNIPIVTTWSGIDAITHDHKNYIGCIGVYGSRAANFVIQNSDFVLSLGSRLDTRVTGGVPKNFARNAIIASVDIDKYELNKKRGLKIEIKINESLKDFFINFRKTAKDININKADWVQKSILWKKKYPIVLDINRKQKKYVNPYFFMEKLSKYLKSDDIVIADDGAHLTWTIQALKVLKKQRLFSAFGNSPMGYAFPASIGASIALKKKRIICIDGDGSIQINIQELQTMVSNQLPIKIIIMNNDGYGIIKQFQELYLNKRYEAVDSYKGVTNPNFSKILKAYGVKYSEIKNNFEIDKILSKTIKSDKAEFINIFVKPDQKIIPKLTFGSPLEDLSPKLSRKEFYENMAVKSVKRQEKLIESN